MKTISFITSFVLLFSLASFSQDDKKAKDILDKLSAKTKSYSTIRTEFDYNLTNKDKKINTTQKWKLWLKGDKYRLDMGDQMVISDGKTVWKYLKNDKEVEISNQTNKEEAMNPKNIFTMYEKGFKFKYVKEAKEGTKTVHLIDLFPTNPKEKEFSSIRLFIDKVATQATKMEVKAKNGNVYTYFIKAFFPNENLTDTQFVFKESDYPGVDVNDLR
jgi:outer membrane lipoprotein-sorting protein